MDYRKEIIDPGNEVSKLGRRICVESYNNSPAISVSDTSKGFRGLVGFRWQDHILEAMLRDEILETPQSDGAGGKPQFFTLLRDEEAFRGLGWELIAMNADDIACGGGLPVAMLASNIDVRHVTRENFRHMKALLEGFGDALAESNLVLITGETAVMKHSITAFCHESGSELEPKQLILTWSGVCLGLTSPNICVDGSMIKPGMAIVGIQEDGYRCNGGTVLTNILMSVWGKKGISGILKSSKAMEFVRKLTIPSRSYAASLARLNGWNLDGSLTEKDLPDIYGMAHITGGGVWDKFGELLPEGVGADLYAMPGPPDILLDAQVLSKETEKPLSDYECYDTFHGGCGVLLVCRSENTDAVINELLDDGHTAKVVGETLPSPEREIRITSRFLHGGKLSSVKPAG